VSDGNFGDWYFHVFIQDQHTDDPLKQSCQVRLDFIDSIPFMTNFKKHMDAGYIWEVTCLKSAAICWRLAATGWRQVTKAIRKISPATAEAFEHEHKGGILCTCLVYNDKYIITASSDLTMKVWDTITGRMLLTQSLGIMSPITSVIAWSDTSEVSVTSDVCMMIATGFGNGKISLWRMKNVDPLIGGFQPEFQPSAWMCPKCKREFPGRSCMEDAKCDNEKEHVDSILLEHVQFDHDSLSCRNSYNGVKSMVFDEYSRLLYSCGGKNVRKWKFRCQRNTGQASLIGPSPGTVTDAWLQRNVEGQDLALTSDGSYLGVAVRLWEMDIHGRLVERKDGEILLIETQTQEVHLKIPFTSAAVTSIFFDGNILLFGTHNGGVFAYKDYKRLVKGSKLREKSKDIKFDAGEPDYSFVGGGLRDGKEAAIRQIIAVDFSDQAKTVDAAMISFVAQKTEAISSMTGAKTSMLLANSESIDPTSSITSPTMSRMFSSSFTSPTPEEGSEDPRADSKRVDDAEAASQPQTYKLIASCDNCGLVQIHVFYKMPTPSLLKRDMMEDFESSLEKFSLDAFVTDTHRDPTTGSNPRDPTLEPRFGTESAAQTMEIKCEYHLVGHKAEVTSIGLSNGLLFSASHDASVAAWNIEDIHGALPLGTLHSAMGEGSPVTFKRMSFTRVKRDGALKVPISCLLTMSNLIYFVVGSWDRQKERVYARDYMLFRLWMEWFGLHPVLLIFLSSVVCIIVISLVASDSYAQLKNDVAMKQFNSLIANNPQEQKALKWQQTKMDVFQAFLTIIMMGVWVLVFTLVILLFDCNTVGNLRKSPDVPFGLATNGLVILRNLTMDQTNECPQAASWPKELDDRNNMAVMELDACMECYAIDPQRSLHGLYLIILGFVLFFYVYFSIPLLVVQGDVARLQVVAGKNFWLRLKGRMYPRNWWLPAKQQLLPWCGACTTSADYWGFECAQLVLKILFPVVGQMTTDSPKLRQAAHFAGGLYILLAASLCKPFDSEVLTWIIRGLCLVLCVLPALVGPEAIGQGEAFNDMKIVQKMIHV